MTENNGNAGGSQAPPVPTEPTLVQNIKSIRVTIDGLMTNAKANKRSGESKNNSS